VSVFEGFFVSVVLDEAGVLEPGRLSMVLLALELLEEFEDDDEA
jgi:hypothetical protein